MPQSLIAVADSVFPSLDPARAELAVLDAEVREAKEPTEQAILEVARKADGILVTYAKITARIINELENCKVIGRFGIGTDNIDLAAASERGIAVTYAPVYCLEEVSDHTMTLLLSLARKIPYAAGLVESGRWEMAAVVPIRRFRGSTLGLVGFGNIPRALAPKAQAFGLNVIASDPFVPAETAQGLGVELVEFDALLERSDYISLHAPFTPETENMFGASAFQKMKSSALLINTARGPLVNVDELAQALDAGEIGGAALDVMPVEPPPADSPLRGRDNVILTPHTAFYSEESLLDLQTTVARDVASVLRGEQPKYPVKPVKK